MMKIILFVLAATGTTEAFLPIASTVTPPKVSTALHHSYMTTELENQLDAIGHKLKLQLYDPNTGVYGFESKDPLYGIENIHCKIEFTPMLHTLGLELTEVAHGESDHRGLVLVSNVEGHAQHDTPVHVGDVVVGVFVSDDFKESTTGFDYDDTVDVINRAKEHALKIGKDHITLELNRLVRRAAVSVDIVDSQDKAVKSIDAAAGDNLRLLLMHNHVNLYDPQTPRLDQPSQTGDCGGDGVCGTCIVDVLEGMEHLNKVGPYEQSLIQGLHRSTWRAACKTVVGADNVEGSTLKIRLHPQSLPTDKLKP